MADQSPTPTGKAPISGSTFARAGVVAGGIFGGPQILVPIIHQWDIVHYSAAQMPTDSFEWSMATLIIALVSLVPTIFIRGSAIISQDFGKARK